MQNDYINFIYIMTGYEFIRNYQVEMKHCNTHVLVNLMWKILTCLFPFNKDKW